MSYGFSNRYIADYSGEAEKKALARKTSKRYREVFPSDEIPHLWFHKVQASARNSTRNFYFNDSTIYSYGSHFPIAKHVTVGRKHAVLLTSRDYSVTTSKHINAVEMAIPRETLVFRVPETDGASHSYNFRYFQSEIDHNFEKAKHSIKAGKYHLGEMESAFEQAKQYKAFFKITGKLPVTLPPAKEIQAVRVKAQDRAERAAVRDANKSILEDAERAQRIALQAVKDAEKVAAWRNGESVGNLYAVPTMLRIKNDVVETSQGASVPIEHAIRGLRIVRLVMSSGREYKRNGHTEHLGHYAVDRITTDGTLYAGCHVITWDEINRIAPALDSISNSSN